MHRAVISTLVLVIASSVGCAGQSSRSGDEHWSGKADDGDSDAGTPDDAGSPDAGGACRSDKMTFDQSTGCRNDGSVEFCLPDGDVQAFADVQNIAPSVICYPDYPFQGRARCLPETHYLCMLPLKADDCVERWGAMTDSSWAQVCELAAHDAIVRIVPTWYE